MPATQKWGRVSSHFHVSVTVLFFLQGVVLSHHMAHTSCPANYSLPKLSQKFPFNFFFFSSYTTLWGVPVWPLHDPISCSSFFWLDVFPMTNRYLLLFLSFFLWLGKTISYVFVFSLLAKNWYFHFLLILTIYCITLEKNQCTDFIRLKSALLIVLCSKKLTSLAYKNKTISLAF